MRSEAVGAVGTDVVLQAPSMSSKASCRSFSKSY